MRHPILATLCAAGVFGLSACEKTIDKDAVDREFTGVNAVDGTGLNDVMLKAADPAEAVLYFQRAGDMDPGRIDLMRGLAASLVRAKRNQEASIAWAKVVDHADSTNDDRVALADALIRNNDWERAEQTLNSIPPTTTVDHLAKQTFWIDVRDTQQLQAVIKNLTAVEGVTQVLRVYEPDLPSTA